MTNHRSRTKRGRKDGRMPRTMLRKYRTAQGFTQVTLSEALGVHHSVVSLWESGRSRPSFDNAMALERALGVPATKILAPLPTTEKGVAADG